MDFDLLELKELGLGGLGCAIGVIFCLSIVWSYSFFFSIFKREKEKKREAILF